MQTHHHETARVAAGLQPGIGIAEQCDELIVNDLHNQLAGLHASQHFLTQRLLLHAGDEPLGDLEIDIRIQQCQPYLTQGFGYIIFGNLSQPAQVLKGLLEFAAQGIKHGPAR